MGLLWNLWQASLPLRRNGFQLQSKRHFAHDQAGDESAASAEDVSCSHVSD